MHAGAAKESPIQVQPLNPLIVKKIYVETGAAATVPASLLNNREKALRRRRA